MFTLLYNTYGAVARILRGGHMCHIHDPALSATRAAMLGVADN